MTILKLDTIFDPMQIAEWDEETMSTIFNSANDQMAEQFDADPEFETLIPAFVQRMKMYEAMAQPYFEQAEIAKAQAMNYIRSSEYFKTLLQNTVDRLPLDRNQKQKFQSPGISVWNQVNPPTVHDSIGATFIREGMNDYLQTLVTNSLWDAAVDALKNDSLGSLDNIVDLDDVIKYVNVQVTLSWDKKKIAQDLPSKSWLQKLFNITRSITVRVRQSKKK